jgi:hypothetical protein
MMIMRPPQHWTRLRERVGLVGLGATGIPDLGLCRPHIEQATRPGDVVGAGTAGEQAVMADEVEAVRQDWRAKAD